MARQAGVVVGDTVSRECFDPFGCQYNGNDPGGIVPQPPANVFHPSGIPAETHGQVERRGSDKRRRFRSTVRPDSIRLRCNLRSRAVGCTYGCNERDASKVAIMARPGGEGEMERGDSSPAVERVDLEFSGTKVALLRVADLQRFVNADDLLAADAVSEPPYWMHLWPGALALARLMAERELLQGESLAGMRVLELGCGLALPSLLAAISGASVVATDWQPTPLRHALNSARLNRSPLQTVQMDWRASCFAGRKGSLPFDLVLGADIAYDFECEEDLVRTLAHLVCRGGRVVLADSVNTYRQTFKRRLEDVGFAVSQSKRREEEEGRAVWVRILEGVKV